MRRDEEGKMSGGDRLILIASNGRRFKDQSDGQAL